MFFTPRKAETSPPEERSKRHSPSLARRGVTGSRLATMMSRDLGAAASSTASSSTLRKRSCSSCLFSALICAIRWDSLSFSRRFFCAISMDERELGDMSMLRPGLGFCPKGPCGGAADGSSGMLFADSIGLLAADPLTEE